jgi:Protein of unknown function (DUF3105)
MASREEEKERRRQEREALEQAEARSRARRRRLQIVSAAVLGLLAIAGIVLAVASGGDDDGGPEPPDDVEVSLPAKKTDDLQAAVRTAGCTFREPRDEGNDHLTNDEATFDDYKSNPPTSGTHRPTPASDGVYEPGNSPEPENWVHTLEHGRIIFQYAPGTPQQRIDQLETLMNETVKGEEGGFKTVVMENNTDMPFAVAAVGWNRFVGCREFTDESFDALRAFRTDFVEDAPEGDFPWPYPG